MEAAARAEATLAVPPDTSPSLEKTDQEGLTPQAETSVFQRQLSELWPKEHFQRKLSEHLDARARLIEAMEPALRAPQSGGDRSTTGYRAMSEAMLAQQLERLDRDFYGFFDLSGYGLEPGPVEEFLGVGGIARSVGRDYARASASKLLLEKSLVSQSQMAELLHGGGKAMAGAGTRREIDDLPRLLSQYGGEASDWTKITSSSYRTAKGDLIETHAYRNIRTLETVELKSKLP